MQPITFLFLSTTDWDAPQFGSRQQIALQLARRGHRVLFVEVPRALHSFISDPAGTRRAIHRMGRVREVGDAVGGRRPQMPLASAPELRGASAPELRGASAPELRGASAPELRGASRLLAYTPPPVLPVYYNRVTNAVNQRLLLGYLRRCLARLGWQVDVLLTYWPNTAHLIGRLGEKVSVYHCIDDFAAVGYPMTSRRAIARMEAQQCRKVDLILTRTAALTTAKRRLNPNTHFLPGGVDTDHFDPSRVRPPPPEVADLPRPRVGFVGTIDDRLDVKLLVRCAVALPAATIVLVGPIRRHRVDVGPLRSLDNVRFLPPCPHSQVPAIVGAFDVCLIPYRINEYTRGLSPVKLYEYLAMGKPVVATNLPYLRREAAHIRIGETPQEFLAEIRAALVPRSMGAPDSSPSTQERGKWRAVAQAHSWERQVSEIERRLAPLLEGDVCTS